MKRLGCARLRLMVLGIAALLLGGCVSLVENAGRVLDGSAFAEKKIAVYRTAKKSRSSEGIELREMRNKTGERSVVITLDRFPTIKIRGNAPDDSGEFSLTALDYLGGSYNGWNEYSLELYGQGTMTLGETSATMSIPQESETVQISWGRIRRYDTRITGNEALTLLRNRHERILALTEWMNSLDGSPKGLSLDDFERHWKPVLFPETVSRKKRPDDWQREDDQWVRAEDIRWNAGYTERVFPELLRNIRNSGTMLRDWEEAIGWMYYVYEWDRILGQLAEETVLGRVK